MKDIQKYLLLQNTSASTATNTSASASASNDDQEENENILDHDTDTNNDTNHDSTGGTEDRPPEKILCIRIVAYRGISVEIYTNAIMEALQPRLKQICEVEAIGGDEGDGIGNDDDDGNGNEIIITKLADLKRQFKELIDPDKDIEAGTIMEMTIEDHGGGKLKMVYSSSIGGGGEITSREFCLALSMIYYGGAIDTFSSSDDGHVHVSGPGIGGGTRSTGTNEGECVSRDHRDNVIRGIRGLKDDNMGDDDGNAGYWGISSTLTKGYDTFRGMF